MSRQMLPITQADKLACVLREIAMRERVYARYVEQGRMKQDRADYEIAVMKEIAKDYGAT